MDDYEMDSGHKTFYFFVENEFMCRPNVNLAETTEESEVFPSYAITMNLLSFSSNQNEKHDPKVNKIYSSFSDAGFNKDQMIKLYRKAEEYIELNFTLCERNSKIFIGCVRDDNVTHKYCIQHYLGFHHRTDPFHDIFNIMKNIYTKESLIVSNLEFNFRDLEWFLECIKNLNPSLHNLLPDVGYFNWHTNKTSKEEKRHKIWMPNTKSAQLDKFIAPLQYLFSSNYFERLLIESKLFANLSFVWLLEFILLIKRILIFIENDTINEDTINTYCELFEELEEYSFMRKRIRCLDSLKDTMETNIRFYEEYKVPFKPKWFSTQGIEAEKGHLRYKAKNSLPTEDQCKDWFHKTMCEGIDPKVDLMGYSEFGEYHLRFDPLPEGSTILF